MEETMDRIFITIIIGYLFGCFQTSYLIGKIFKNVDIRSLGNGNAGASNTTVTLGWKYGILVALIDILKAVVSIMFVTYLLHNVVSNSFLLFLKYLNGFFVIIGHNYPFYLRFQGGKGTASLIGMLLTIDIRLGLVGILSIVIATIITDYIAIGTIALVLSFTLGTILLKYNIGSILVAIAITLLSIYNHLPNIKKIIAGTETGLRKTFKK